MSYRRGADWSRLDNAAKIFPPTSSKRDTRVFRFACELFDEVDGEILQRALDCAAEKFPNFLFVLKRGFFWYYLEKSDLRPVVLPETEPPCSKIYGTKKKMLLFDVTYYKNRINLEVYHVLTDGTGALRFLLTIVYHYLAKRHKSEMPENLPPLEYDASFKQKTADSFQKYYKNTAAKSKDKRRRAFDIRTDSFPSYGLNIITGVMSVKRVLGAAHRYNTTLTVFLTAQLIASIHEEMMARDKKSPVVISVPVNLRKHFPSETTKNFFGIISVGYDFSKGSGELEDIISEVDSQFKRELTQERLAARLNSLAALEHNLFVRIAPLPLKNIVLRIAGRIVSRRDTMVLSNVGKVELPPELAKYVRLFDVFTSTSKIQLCMCSFGDVLDLSFTSTLNGTETEKNFFRRLAQSMSESGESTEPAIEIRGNMD